MRFPSCLLIMNILVISSTGTNKQKKHLAIYYLPTNNSDEKDVFKSVSIAVAKV